MAQSNTSPALLLGRFVDDYGSQYDITSTTWRQGAHAEYSIEKWNAAGGYLIAQNAQTNPSDAGLWTRIDWVRLDGMAPYTWAYCYSAYKAPTAAAAESVSIARRATLKTGCNGYPFSRMRPVALEPAHDSLAGHRGPRESHRGGPLPTRYRTTLCNPSASVSVPQI
jgi:hypothetical protein